MLKDTSHTTASQSYIETLPQHEDGRHKGIASSYNPFQGDKLTHTNRQDQIESIILNPDLAPLLAILKAARNGAVYGAKVRFPHALVMVMMFRSGPFKEKVRLVLKATKQHASNLARFAVVYKSTMLILRLINPLRPGKEGPYDAFFAGLAGGYTVFGRAAQSR